MSRNAFRPTSFDHWLKEESSWDQRHDDREYSPKMTAPNSVEQEWRIPRLVRLYATTKQLFLIIEQRPLPATIVDTLDDNLGKLTVTLSSDEWRPFLDPIFRLAWRSESEKPDAVRLVIR